MIPNLPPLQTIVAALEASELSQRQIAKISGLSQPAISKLFAGQQVRYSTLQTICLKVREAMQQGEPAIPVQEICATPLRSVKTTDRVLKATQLMGEFGIDQVPVFRGKEPIGSVVSEDLVRRRLEGTDYLELVNLPVTAIMGKAFPVVDGTESLSAVRPFLLARPAVLVRISGIVAGILTWSDILDPNKNVSRTKRQQG